MPYGAGAGPTGADDTGCSVLAAGVPYDEPYGVACAKPRRTHTTTSDRRLILTVDYV